ncbi:MAG: tRNA glutamyl-Q(34) synthetase GluQRS [Casimicrobiaceae bacterium]|nr:tRNA glutamyl-Q(34) synthetase GluQRS [Casimicrobiaceae bacterium]MDW8313234.1 tRNA glutamyl-Q(34) synthetase GluQRS [Burkholderiales bacterium]
MDPAGQLICASAPPQPSYRYVGRFAPSPTGPLHLGSLVAALASWADARAHGGAWFVRLEDVDATRCSKEHARRILRQLAACGLESDAPVWVQSARTRAYQAALERLVATGAVFACACSRRLLEQAPLNRYGERIYPGTCAARRLSFTGHALRLRLPDRALVRCDDRRHGTFEQDVAAEVGAFVLRRADGCFSYTLAVVVDDAEQGVTDVVRGDDLLSNTPRQVLLQRLLALPSPRYLHLPLVRASDGQKLSKQTLARAIAEDEALAALREAWCFLGQIDPGRVTDVAAFLRHAASHWDPARLPTPERCHEAPGTGASAARLASTLP